jgi:hypothetical protein
VLRPPYETLSDEQQAGLSENKWLCIREDALAQSEDLFAQEPLRVRGGRLYLYRAAEAFRLVAEEAQKPNPNQQIIDWFTQSVGMFQQAAEAEAADQLNKAPYLHGVGIALIRAAFEAQKPEPNQQRIQQYLKEAEDWKIRAEETDQACCTIS